MRMNFYPRYCGDYGRDTGHLTLAEHGAYALLLDAYYSTETPLPADELSLFRLCRAMTPDEQDAVRSVARQFFPVGSDGQRHNPRADVEIPKAQRRVEIARQNGRLSASQRGTQRGTQRVNSPTPTPEEDKSKSNRARFARPTVEQVAEYVTSIGKTIDAAYFVDYYTSKGWLVGKSPMKDWQAAVRGWINRGQSNGSGNRPKRDSVEDRSAAGRVRANVARERAERSAARSRGEPVADDGVALWP